MSLIVVNSPGHAQSIIELTATQCEDCRIRLTGVVSITDGTGAGGLALPNTLAVDAHGRVLVVTNIAPAAIAVYGTNGHFERTVGRAGNAPGEFQRIEQIAVRGEGFDIFDYALNRWTEVGGDFSLRRTTQLPASPMRAVRWRQRLVVNARIATPELAGYPVHVISDDGTLFRSYAYDSLAYRMDIPYADLRHLAVCPNGWLWWSGVQKYRIDGVSSGGARRTIERRSNWFEPHLSRPLYTAEAGAPPPMLNGLACDEKNRLWTVTHVADPEWRSAGLRRADVDYHGTDWELHFQPQRYFDTIIEVIDTDRAEILATARSDRWLRYLTPEGFMATYEEPDGAPILTIWRAELIESPPILKTKVNHD